MQKETIYKPCPVCNEELLADQKKFMIPVEVPYLNIFVHRECWRIIKDDLLNFLTKNIEKYLINTKK